MAGRGGEGAATANNRSLRPRSHVRRRRRREKPPCHVLGVGFEVQRHPRSWKGRESCSGANRCGSRQRGQDHGGPESVNKLQSLVDARKAMTDAGINSVVVSDSDAPSVGILTSTDSLRLAVDGNTPVEATVDE